MTATLSLKEQEILTVVTESGGWMRTRYVTKRTRFGSGSVRDTLNDLTERGYLERRNLYNAYEFSAVNDSTSKVEVLG